LSVSLVLASLLKCQEGQSESDVNPREGAMKVETDVKAGGAIWQHNETIVG
jgi:hypothetical protein